MRMNDIHPTYKKGLILIVPKPHANNKKGNDKNKAKKSQKPYRWLSIIKMGTSVWNSILRAIEGLNIRAKRERR